MTGMRSLSLILAAATIPGILGVIIPFNLAGISYLILLSIFDAIIDIYLMKKYGVFTVLGLLFAFGIFAEFLTAWIPFLAVIIPIFNLIKYFMVYYNKL